MRTTTLGDGTLLLVSPDQVGEGELADYELRNRDFLAPWEPVRDEAYFLPRTQRAVLDREARAWEQGASRRFYLRLAEEPGLVVGSIGLLNIVRGAFQSCHVGIRLDGGRINRGIATTATLLLLGYAFGELGLHRVEANVMPRNARSRRVLEKCGFACEGLSHRYLKINGVWEDHLHYVRLADDGGPVL